MKILRSKKGILLSVGIALTLLGIVAALLYLFLGPKTFVIGNDQVGRIHLTLPREFKITEEIDSSRTRLETEDVMIGVYQEEARRYPPTVLERPLENFVAELIHYSPAIGQGEDAMQTLGDMIYFEYESKDYETGEMQYSLTVAFKGRYDRGYLLFRTASENKDTYRAQFLDWAQTLEFTDDHWPESWK